MFKCNNCGRLFSEEATVTIDTGVRSEHYIESYDIAVCPHCGSNDYDSVRKCLCCGEYQEMYDDDWCEDCWEQMCFEMGLACSSVRQKYDMRPSPQTVIALAKDVVGEMEDDYWFGNDYARR